ncbi:MAG TPA: hypothetical protein VFV08_08275, partial [Puia sp.]|nr:hypothetical protein [Puia sp.]
MSKNLTQAPFMAVFIFLSFPLFSQSPGNVIHPSSWVTGNTYNGTVKTQLNFNPAFDLNNREMQREIPGSIESLRRATVFTVYQDENTSVELPLWEMTGKFGDMELSTRRVLSKYNNTSILFTKNSSNTGLSTVEKTGAVIHTYVRSNVLAFSPGDEASLQNSSIRFGSSFSSTPGSHLNRLLSEFILYEKILSDKEMARVESYLALKYGITLQRNYLNSQGEIVWNVEKDKSYSNHIAGIARDDESVLYQKQGTSSNYPGQLVMGIDKIAPSNDANKGLLNNKDFLVWGDNGQPFRLNSQTVDLPERIMLPETKWMMKVSGATANKISTALKIDTKTLLPEYLPAEKLCLVIDRSGSGNFTPG